LLGYLALGPFVVAFDLVTHIFPDAPGIALMRSGSAAVHAALIGCGPLCIVAILLLRRRPLWGFLATVVLGIVYFLAFHALWHQYGWPVWLAAAVPCIAGYGVFGEGPAPAADD
jgi:hypothetical protein